MVLNSGCRLSFVCCLLCAAVFAGCNERVEYVVHADAELCDYTGSKCNADGTALLTCSGGKETTRTCTCTNDACEDEPECDYADTRCNADGTEVLMCHNGEEISIQECICKNGDCVECSYSGSRCRSDGRALLHCDENGIEVVETCTCENNACKVEPCDSDFMPTCSDNFTALTCVEDKLKYTPCEGDNVCANGECLPRNQEVSCDFDTECSADLTSLRKCSNGKVTYVLCGHQKYCDSDTNTCVDAVVDGKCDEGTFIPYCDNNTAVYCNNTSVKHEPCNTMVCDEGICKQKTSVKAIGDECNPETFKQQCIGETPVECNQKSKHVVPLEDVCTADGSICGEISDFGVQEARCFEPCTTKGAMRNTCTVTVDKTYQSVYECIDIGHNCLGYEMVTGTWQPCDIGCASGKCYDYTQGIEHIGEECPDNFKGYCKASNLAVSCEIDDSGEEIISTVQAELCYPEEVCAVITEDGKTSGKCMVRCDEGDPDRYECSALFDKFVSYKHKCQLVDGKMVYANTGDFDLCTECNADGSCK